MNSASLTGHKVLRGQSLTVHSAHNLQGWSYHRGHSINKPICFPRTILKSLQKHGLEVAIHQQSPHGCPWTAGLEINRTLAPSLCLNTGTKTWVSRGLQSFLSRVVWVWCISTNTAAETQGSNEPVSGAEVKQEWLGSWSPSSHEKTTAEARIGLTVTTKADVIMKQGSPTCTQHISLFFNSCHHLRQHGSLTTYRHPILNRQNIEPKKIFYFLVSQSLVFCCSGRKY